jgi:hypothetical protein
MPFTIHRRQDHFRSVWTIKDEFTDVTVFGYDSKDGIKAHKIILAAASPYFRGRLKTSDEIRLDQFSEQYLTEIIQLIYTGEILVESGRYKRLINIIKFLSITIKERNQDVASVSQPLNKDVAAVSQIPQKKQNLSSDLSIR